MDKTLIGLQTNQQRLGDRISSLLPTEQDLFISRILSRSRSAGRWLLQTLQYRAWYDVPETDLLLITAGAGCGKTTLAAHISQWVISEDAAENAAVLQFFFQGRNQETEGTALSALQTIIVQLVSIFAILGPLLIKSYDALSIRGSVIWSWDTLWGLFKKMINFVPSHIPVYLIFDAVDECEIESQQQLLDGILMLLEERRHESKSSGPVLKFLITSRPEGGISDVLSGYQLLELSMEDTIEDMHKFITHRVQRFCTASTASGRRITENQELSSASC